MRLLGYEELCRSRREGVISASVDNTLRVLHKSLYPTEAKLNLLTFVDVKFTSTVHAQNIKGCSGPANRLQIADAVRRVVCSDQAQSLKGRVCIDHRHDHDSQCNKRPVFVAMGSPLGPLLANVFTCSIDETLEHEGKMPTNYRRYIDNSLTIKLEKRGGEKAKCKRQD